MRALGRIDLGFDADRVLTMRVSVPTARYDTPEKVVGFYRQLNERVRALPGVEAAGFVRVLPLATTIGDFGLDVEGFEEAPGRNAKGDWQIVSDGAFEAMGAACCAADGSRPPTRALTARGGGQRDDGAHLLVRSEMPLWADAFASAIRRTHG